MRRPLVVGVDLGSQSTKAALFGLDGECMAEAWAEVPLHRPAPGHVEQRPGDFYDSATATISSCVTASGCKPADVAVIGFAGQMAGILGVDARGHAVTPYDSWLDSRCLTEVGEMAERFGPRLVELTGCPPMVAHAAKMLWWLRQSPDVYSRVKKFLVPSAFVAGMFCDLPADESFVDWTYLHFSGLADAGTASWSPELGRAMGLDLGKLPRIVPPTDRIGALSRGAAADCGLRPGTPVAAGLGDTAAGALGAGVVQPGQLLDTAGTASVLAISASRFAPDPSGTLVLMRGAVPGQWLSLSYLAGGELLTWLPGVLGAPSLERLVEEAASAQSSNLFFVPHLGGRVLPAAPTARGGWVGVDLTQARGDLARAVLESVAFEYAGFLDKALELYPELVPRDVRVIGGGSADQLWNQLKASALGLPYVRMRPRSFSCWGAALVAAAAVGEVDDLGSAALQAGEVSDRTEPDPQLQASYSERKRHYQALVDLLVSGAQKVPA